MLRSYKDERYAIANEGKPRILTCQQLMITVLLSLVYRLQSPAFGALLYTVANTSLFIILFQPPVLKVTLSPFTAAEHAFQ